MAVVSENIPNELQAEADAALAWFNASQEDDFDITAIVDAERSIESAQPRELQLVLCGGDICQKQTFEVSSTDTGFEVRLPQNNATVDAEGPGPQAELDPPPGARRNWLDATLEKHTFTLLLFYRGFW